MSSSLNLDALFGAALVGNHVAALMFGVLSLQVWLYLNRYPQDPLWSKILVITTWALQGFQLGTTIHLLYKYLIIDLATDPFKLLVITWDYDIYLGISSTIAFLVQGFFIRRVFILTEKWVYVRWILCSLIFILALLQLGFGLAYMSEGFILEIFPRLLEFNWGLDAWVGTSCGADILIAGSMCYFLHSSRRGLSNQTDRVIRKLMIYSVQTGLLTSVAALISLSTFTALGFNFTAIFLSFNMGPLYSTSLLANLLARRTSKTPPSEGDTERSRATPGYKKNITPETSHLGPLKFAGDHSYATTTTNIATIATIDTTLDISKGNSSTYNSNINSRFSTLSVGSEGNV